MLEHRIYFVEISRPVYFEKENWPIEILLETKILLLFIISTLSIVQSLFGVGLLVFGTPILLLLGYSFDFALTILLPPSITISLIQVLDNIKLTRDMQKRIIFYSIPGIIAGLLCVLLGLVSVNMGLIVGLMLLLSVFIRQIYPVQIFIKKIIILHLNYYISVMGFIHGLSNMGGGLLTIMATTIFEKKEMQRKNIAFGYLIFGVTQIVLLFIFKLNLFTFWSVIFPFVSCAIYFSIGNKIFIKTPETSYNRLISLLLFTFGIVLITYSAIKY